MSEREIKRSVPRNWGRDLYSFNSHNQRRKELIDPQNKEIISCKSFQIGLGQKSHTKIFEGTNQTAREVKISPYVPGYDFV